MLPDSMLRLFLGFTIAALLPWSTAHALPPPDLIMTALQSVMQVFGALAAMVIVFALSAWQWMQEYYRLHKKLVWGIGIMFILAFPVSVLLVSNYQQQQWKTQTKQTFLDAAQQAQQQIRSQNSEQAVQNARQKVLSEMKKMQSSQSDTQTRVMDLDFSGALNYQSFKTKLEEPGLQIIDVRSSVGFEKGHIAGSQNYPLPDLLFGGWRELDPHQPVLIVCYAGSSGVVASHFLQSLNFKEVYFPAEGIYRFQHQLADFNFQGIYFDPYVSIPQTELNRSSLPSAAITIDFRSTEDLASDPIGNDLVINPDMAFYQTDRLQRWLESSDPQIPYVLVCDSPITCYNSAVMTYRLQQTGRQVLGTVFTKGTWGALTVKQT